jgi:hypothetical protein
MQITINLSKDIDEWLLKESEFLDITLERLIELYLTERVKEKIILSTNSEIIINSEKNYNKT